MQYHGITLSTTFCRHTVSGDRYAYVSGPDGFPYESIGRVRWDRLKRMSEGLDGWRVIGTWPVAKHPEDVWSR